MPRDPVLRCSGVGVICSMDRLHIAVSASGIYMYSTGDGHVYMYSILLDTLCRGIDVNVFD